MKFFGVDENDPLFQHVILPRGWRKEPKEDSRGSMLVDDKGYRRADIFYKNTDYDRRASLSLLRRYYFICDYDRVEADGMAVFNVVDRVSDTVIHTTEPIKITVFSGMEYEKFFKMANKAAETWLDEYFPNWRDPGTYWD